MACLKTKYQKLFAYVIDTTALNDIHYAMKCNGGSNMADNE